MYELKAIASFDHHGSRRAGDKFKVGSKRHADDLVSKGLVELIGESKPESEKQAGDAPAAAPVTTKAVKKTTTKKAG